MRERDRRSELLGKLLDYSATHGLSEVSLRPLAAAVGSSPRMLLYFFGSKQELVREVHRHARHVQLSLFTETLAGCDNRADALRALWQWLRDPAHHNVIRFFFESYARSLHETDAGDDFGAASVREWLPPLRAALGGSETEATLTLAALRGLVLDLLATGDVERIDIAFERLVSQA